jgi:hypothetical protein
MLMMMQFGQLMKLNKHLEYFRIHIKHQMEVRLHQQELLHQVQMDLLNYGLLILMDLEII